MTRPKPTRPSPVGDSRRLNTQETLDHFLDGLSPASPPGQAADADAAHVAGELLRRQLTEVGADATAIAARVSVALRVPGTPAEKPRWIASAGELWWSGMLVRFYRDDAANQRLILAAFEKAGWPPGITDPLPNNSVTNAKKRRWQTVKSLNLGMRPATIRFSSDGIGGFHWDVVI